MLLTATAGTTLLLLLLVLELVRRRHLDEIIAWAWILGLGTVGGLALWRGALDALAGALGSEHPTILFLALGLLAATIGLLLLSAAHSRQRMQIERLIEDVAILEARLREVRDQEPDSSSATSRNAA